MSEQPKALRLADMVLSLRSHLGPWRDESDSDEQAAWDGYTEAAAELRRLHALCDDVALRVGPAHLGLCDAIDNDGQPYQSQALADEITALRGEVK